MTTTAQPANMLGVKMTPAVRRALLIAQLQLEQELGRDLRPNEHDMLIALFLATVHKARPDLIA